MAFLKNREPLRGWSEMGDGPVFDDLTPLELIGLIALGGAILIVLGLVLLGVLLGWLLF